MSKARIMGAGNAGASKFIKLNGNVCGGNKKTRSCTINK